MQGNRTVPHWPQGFKWKRSPPFYRDRGFFSKSIKTTGINPHPSVNVLCLPDCSHGTDLLHISHSHAPTCANKSPPTFPQLKDGGKQPRRHTDESPPGEKTEKKLRLQRWNITGMDKWRRWRDWEDDGELGWWDELSDKLVMNASVGGRRKGGDESELEEEWMKRPRKTVWWSNLELMESHREKSS